MSTVFDGGKSDLAQGRQAADWGLASLLLGGILAVMAMLLLQICLYLFLSPSVWGTEDVKRLHDVAIYGRIVFITAGIVSIAFAIRSLALAYNRSQPSALGWAGLLISLIALALWIGVLFDLFEVVEFMARRQGMGGLF